MTTPCFSSLKLPPEVLKNLISLGYENMTPIQAQSLPHVIQGKDLIAQAKTGSGKTAAFGIGLLNNLNVKLFAIQALILCPTRELADQVAKELRRLARATHNVKILALCGGMPFGPQIGSLEHGAHIVVGTPGRIQEHLRKNTLKLDRLTTFVLDEADRMLDMGFRDAISAVADKCPNNRQTLLFSATFPKEIQKISQDFQRDPVQVTVEAVHEAKTIEQHFYEIEKNQRHSALVSVLRHFQPESSVIFCNTKRQTQEVADTLNEQGFHALAIHGDLEQRDRDQVLVRFSNQSCPILVATDVAARGLDIKDLSAVINYELSRDPEVHVHRIGRTGRAGQSGLALSLFSASESYKLNTLEDYAKQRFEPESADNLSDGGNYPQVPKMVTIQIDGGRKNKMRPGDILGALTGNNGIPGTSVGKIALYDFHAYVAIHRDMAAQALSCLQNGKIKGRSCKVRKLK